MLRFRILVPEQRGRLLPPCLGMKGGFDAFVMACLGRAGKGVPAPVTGVMKRSPGSNFTPAPGPKPCQSTPL